LQLWKLCGKPVLNSDGIWAVAAAPIFHGQFSALVRENAKSCRDTLFSSVFPAAATATIICIIKKRFRLAGELNSHKLTHEARKNNKMGKA